MLSKFKLITKAREIMFEYFILVYDNILQDLIKSSDNREAFAVSLKTEMQSWFKKESEVDPSLCR